MAVTGSVIPLAWASSDPVLVHAKASLGVAVGLFVIRLCLPVSTPADAARQSFRLVLVLIVVEFALAGILLYCTLALGSPWPAAASSSPIPLLPGGQVEWTFSFWRPVTVLLMIGSGVMATTSPYPKYLCISGCCWDALQDLLSMMQLGSYLAQVSGQGAPLGAYSLEQLTTLYWRDVVALGASFLLLLVCIELLALQGVWMGGPPRVTWQETQGGLVDRARVLCQQRYSRLSAECDSALLAAQRAKGLDEDEDGDEDEDEGRRSDKKKQKKK